MEVLSLFLYISVYMYCVNKGKFLGMFVSLIHVFIFSCNTKNHRILILWMQDISYEKVL